MYQNLWWPTKTATVFDKTATNNDSIREEEQIKNKDGKTQMTKEKRRLRLFSAFKHTNGTKLSSHLLFFEGFCRFMKPEFCVLLDVGTKPS